MNAVILESLLWAEKCGLQGQASALRGRRLLRFGDVVLCEAKYSPGIAAILELLHRKCGVEKVIRIATCGSLASRTVGTVLAFEGAHRDEGTTAGYAPLGFPAIADSRLLQALERQLVARGCVPHRCLVWTTDCRFREGASQVAAMRDLGVAAVDMETSALYVVARSLGIGAASVGLVTDVVDPVASDDDRFFFDEPDDLLLEPMRKAIESAVSALSGIGAGDST
jgi:uridine phosphorylase